MRTQLREGFTTGTASAAAAFAAVTLLLGGECPDSAEVTLPPFAEDGTPAAVENVFGDGARSTPPALAIPIEQGRREGEISFASVVKDGGDDPDATHGVSIVVYAAVRPFPLCPERDGKPSEPCRPLPPGRDAPARPVQMNLFSRTVVLYGGAGVGTVTLPGLPVAVGEPAINPEPRKQIAAAAHAAARAAGYNGPLHLLLSVPEGEERARRTLNGRLGIAGGISILGTRGTVRPYSHDAWKCAVAQGMDVAAALGLREILLATGRRSERLGLALYPDFLPQAGIQAADYAAFSLREAARRPFDRVIWACFPGKLLKLAQGLEWTHAGAAPTDLAMLARLCREAGGPDDLIVALGTTPTAAGAFALMKRQSARLRDAVLERLAHLALKRMLVWLREARTDGSHACPELVLHVFSPEERLLLSLRAD